MRTSGRFVYTYAIEETNLGLQVTPELRRHFVLMPVWVRQCWYSMLYPVRKIHPRGNSTVSTALRDGTRRAARLSATIRSIDTTTSTGTPLDKHDTTSAHLARFHCIERGNTAYARRVGCSDDSRLAVAMYIYI